MALEEEVYQGSMRMAKLCKNLFGTLGVQAKMLECGEKSLSIMFCSVGTSFYISDWFPITQKSELVEILF